MRRDLRKGDQVIAVTDIGSRLRGKFVPQGSQGVVKHAGWGSPLNVQFEVREDVFEWLFPRTVKRDVERDQVELLIG